MGKLRGMESNFLPIYAGKMLFVYRVAPEEDDDEKKIVLQSSLGEASFLREKHQSGQPKN